MTKANINPFEAIIVGRDQGRDVYKKNATQYQVKTKKGLKEGSNVMNIKNQE